MEAYYKVYITNTKRKIFINAIIEKYTIKIINKLI